MRGDPEELIRKRVPQQTGNEMGTETQTPLSSATLLEHTCSSIPSKSRYAKLVFCEKELSRGASPDSFSFCTAASSVRAP